MNRWIRHSGISVLLAAAALGVTACGGGGGSSTPNGTAAAMSQMQLSVADAPIDGASHVVVVFTGVELLPNSGNPITITFAQPKRIDLLTQSGTASAVLFDQPIPAGTYGQVRLLVNADGSGNNSYIQLSDGTMHGLIVPSGAQTGLKLVSGFTVPASGVVDYTIDFDLRKSITCPGGQSSCFLQPALRLVDNTTVGNIQGNVSAALFTGTSTAPCIAPAVYLYSGATATPQGYYYNGSGPYPPVSSKVPTLDTATNSYYYQFTFLPPGSYTVAYTCDADLDTSPSTSPMTFAPVIDNVSVVATQTTTVDIQ